MEGIFIDVQDARDIAIPTSIGASVVQIQGHRAVLKGGTAGLVDNAVLIFHIFAPLFFCVVHPRLESRPGAEDRPDCHASYQLLSPFPARHPILGQPGGHKVAVAECAGLLVAEKDDGVLFPFVVFADDLKHLFVNAGLLVNQCGIEKGRVCCFIMVSLIISNELVIIH
jgi:hypothetical protein